MIDNDFVKALNETFKFPVGKGRDEHHVRSVLAFMDIARDERDLSVAAEIRPVGDDHITLNFGAFVVHVFKEGISLVLSQQTIKAIKGFLPEHSRVVVAFDGKEEHLATIISKSQILNPPRVNKTMQTVLDRLREAGSPIPITEFEAPDDADAVRALIARDILGVTADWKLWFQGTPLPEGS